MISKKGYIWLILVPIIFTVAAIHGMLSEASEASGSKQSQSVTKLDASAIEQILSSHGENSTEAKIAAPVFSLKSLDGTTHTIGEKAEKARLINFWASWCEACSVEASTLNSLYDRFGNVIDFYGINIVTEEAQLDNIEKFIQQNQITFPTLLDEHKRAAYLYDLHALPTSFLIDANGNVIETFHLLDFAEFEAKIERFLAD